MKHLSDVTEALNSFDASITALEIRVSALQSAQNPAVDYEPVVEKILAQKTAVDAILAPQVVEALPTETPSAE